VSERRRGAKAARNNVLSGAAAGDYRLPLRGRENEADALEEGFAAALSAEHAITLVSGEAGIGKTRLLQQALWMASRRKWTTLVVAPDIDSAMAPFGALVEALLRETVLAIDEYTLSETLQRTSPHYWLTRLVADRLENVAKSSGVLVVVDDAQWLDPASLKVLDGLLRNLDGLPIHWLIATGDGAHTPAHTRFISEARALGVELILGPLSVDAARQIAHDALGRRPGPGLEKTMERAGGQPLILLELLRGLEEEGLLLPAEDMLDVSGDALPARFGASARERLRSVSPEALRIAQVGSLYGRRFSLSGVLDIIGATAGAAAAAVQELLDLGLIVDTGLSVAFRHDTIQAAASDSISPTLRRAISREVLYARLRAGEPAGDLAATLAAVAEPGEDDATELLFTAAQQLAAADPSGAAELAVLGARNAVGRDVHAERVAALIPVILAAGRRHDAASIARSVSGYLTPDSRARVSLAIARHLTEADFDEAIKESTRGLSIAGVSDELKVELLAVRALNYANKADAKGLRASLKLARVLADDKRDGFALATIDATESVLFFYQDQLDAAQRLQRQALARVLDAAVESALWLPEGLWMAFMRNSLGFCVEALELVDTGLERARAARNVIAEAYWMMIRSRVLFDLGRLDDARAQAETVLELAAQLGLGDFANATAGIVLHRIALQTGDVELRECARTLVVSLAEGVGLRRTGTWSLAIEAMYGFRPSEAYEHAQLALGSLREPVPSMTTPADFIDDVMLSLICRNAGDEASLEVVAKVTQQRSERNPRNALLAAVALAVSGIRDRDPDPLFRAVAWARKGQRPLITAGILEIAGQMAADTPESLAALEEALALYETAGASQSAGRILHILRGRGVRRRLKSGASDPTELSLRELQVADRIAAGLTTQQIADDLLVSPHTVVTHVRHIYAKWGVHTRREVTERLRASRSS
jgi:DNA-binding CsgD family transcriptional regulator